MRTFSLAGLAVLALAAAPRALADDFSEAQGSLAAAIAGQNGLSNFRSLLEDRTTLLSEVLPNGTTPGLTIFIPNDDALAAFMTENGPLNDQPAGELASILQYHILAADVPWDNLTVPGGLSVPTLLKGDKFNNRTAGIGFTQQFGDNADGQVVFVSKDPLDGGLKVRAEDHTNIRSGLSDVASITRVNGNWSYGTYHIVDSVLQRPLNCAKTIRAKADDLSALDAALNKTGIWDALNTSRNVTCLAPNTKAFQDAGSPEESLSTDMLSNALLFHTLQEVAYSDRLQDGQVLTSLARNDSNPMMVRVTVNDTGLFFNDAKVVQKNVLTNNGLVHVLDRIMSPLEDTAANGTATATGTATASPSATTSATAGSGAGLPSFDGLLVGAAAVIAAAALV